ncbi:putative toxin-antitoxin system toxin component, PIN family [Oceanithermus sp.]
MIRAVIDPGVLIAAVLSPSGAPAELLRCWLAGAFEMVVSEKLLDELEQVLLREKFRAYLSQAEVRRYIALLKRWAAYAVDAAHSERYTSDPNDDYRVALALSAHADFIVSGDKHLTGLTDPAAPVLTPREAVELLERLERGRG